MTYSDGSVYEGQWTDDKRTGTGAMEWKNGTKYNGDFEDDKNCEHKGCPCVKSLDLEVLKLVQSIGGMWHASNTRRNMVRSCWYGALVTTHSC